MNWFKWWEIAIFIAVIMAIGWLVIARVLWLFRHISIVWLP